MRKAKRRKPEGNPVSAELRAAGLYTAGAGCFGLYTTAGEMAPALEWLGPDAGRELCSAAERLGFGVDQWHAVARAVAKGALGDLLSEAIEAVEAPPLVVLEVAV